MALRKRKEGVGGTERRLTIPTRQTDRQSLKTHTSIEWQRLGLVTVEDDILESMSENDGLSKNPN